MRLVLGGVAGALSLVLAGCGSSNSNPAPAPTPTPTSTPSPTPTPTATPTPITYTTSEAALQYSAEGGVQRIANATSVAPVMGTVFAFTPAQNGYTYTLLDGPVAPSPSEAAVFPVASIRDCDVTPLCFGDSAFVFQQITAGAGHYTLSRYITGPGNPLQTLSSVGFGVFVESLQESAARLLVDLRPFAYGVASPSGAIPTTGTATFKGPLVGQATGNKPGATGSSNVYRLTGTLELVANYAAGTATLKLTIAGDAVGCTTCSPDINLTYESTAGTLASGVMTFTLPGGGTARFFLAGGAAAGTSTSAVPPTEVGGSFVLTAADPNEGAVTMVVTGSGGGAR